MSEDEGYDLLDPDENDDSVKEKRISKAYLFSQMAEIIDNGGLKSEERFFVVEPEPGMRLVVKLFDEGVVKYVKEEAVSIAIYNHVRYLKGWNFDAAAAQKAKDVWLMASRPIEIPYPVLMKSERGLCFHRLPFDANVYNESKHPLFTEMLSRTTNPKAFKAFFGSLFYIKSDRSQYLWMFGEGDNGKGSWIRLALRVFGSAAIATSTPSKSNGGTYDKHWTARLLGKRLATFADVDDYGIIKTGFFKSLTGNDRTPIERKFKDPFDEQLICKFMFASNEKPAVGDQKSDRKRIIYCEMKPFLGEVDPSYDEKLWQEAPYIIASCRKAYEDLCPMFGVIPIDDSDGLETLIESNMGEFQYCLDKYFKKIPNKAEVVEKRDGIRSSEFHQVVTEFLHWDRKKIAQFKKYLLSKHCIEFKPVKKKGSVEKLYVGLFRRCDLCTNDFSQPDNEAAMMRNREVTQGNGLETK
jgi:hypothetical protein